jgi:hypothetical protein
MVSTGSLVVKKLGGNRAGEMAVHRFLSSPHVSVSTIADALAARTAEQCAGRRTIVIQDTTEINFKGRAVKRQGLGPAGNGLDPGFFIHPVVAVDVENEAVVGLVGLQVWTRSQETDAPAQEDTAAGKKSTRAFSDKASARWHDGCVAATILSEAAALTMIADRESDIYELFAQRPERLDLIVRVAQDRRLAEGGRLFDALADAPELAPRSVRVPPKRIGDTGPPGRTCHQGGHGHPPAAQQPPDRYRSACLGHAYPGRGGRDQSAQSQGGRGLASVDHALGRQRRGGAGGHRPLPPALAHRTGVPCSQE